MDDIRGRLLTLPGGTVSVVRLEGEPGSVPDFGIGLGTCDGGLDGIPGLSVLLAAEQDCSRYRCGRS